MGSTDWKDLGLMAVVTVGLSVYCYANRRDYNALLSGEETAISLVSM